MAYITEQRLAESARKYNQLSRENVVSFSALAELTIFLAHSHKDQEKVEGIIYEMGRQGIKIYVDWNDATMPRETSKETAEKIKAKIKELQIFLVLGTNNAMKSVWVPWETGVADQCKSNDQVFIIPIEDKNGNFYGNEYLQLYQKIELDHLGNLKIVAPNKNINEGVDFGEHFRKISYLKKLFPL